MNQTNENYMSPAKEARLLAETEKLTLATNVALQSDTTFPRIATTGNSVVHLYGKVSITTASAGMKLADLPSSRAHPIIPLDAVVAVENAGTFSTGVVHIDSDGVAVVGTPTNADIYHLDNICYIDKSGS